MVVQSYLGMTNIHTDVDDWFDNIRKTMKSQSPCKQTWPHPYCTIPCQHCVVSSESVIWPIPGHC